MLRYSTMFLTGSLLAGLLLTGCKHDDGLNRAEFNEMILTPPQGLLAGFRVGDSWEKVKGEHDKRFTVSEKLVRFSKDTDPVTMYRLRRDIVSSGEEGFVIDFYVDDKGLLTGSMVSVAGENKNVTTVHQIFDDVAAHFEKKFGKGDCEKSQNEIGDHVTCTWGQKNAVHARGGYHEKKKGTLALLAFSENPPEK